jgi:hypothetical protein
MMPASMNPNAGMSEQEQQMVKAVCNSLKSPTMFQMNNWALNEPQADNTCRCKWAWNHVLARLSWQA